MAEEFYPPDYFPPGTRPPTVPYAPSQADWDRASVLLNQYKDQLGTNATINWEAARKLFEQQAASGQGNFNDWIQATISQGQQWLGTATPVAGSKGLPSPDYQGGGISRKKWDDPTHTSDKYVLLRALSATGLTPAEVRAQFGAGSGVAVEAMKALGYEIVSNNQVYKPGIGRLDVIHGNNKEFGYRRVSQDREGKVPWKTAAVPKPLPKPTLIDAPGCFVAGTLIATPTGLRPIEAFEVGDPVFAVAGGQLVTSPVAAVMVHVGVPIHVATHGGQAIEATRDHPFYNPDLGAYVPLKAAHVGMSLQVFDAEGHPQAVKIASLTPSDSLVPVYNLTIDGPHTYLANGIHVHNKQRILPPTPSPPAAGVPAATDSLIAPWTKPFSYADFAATAPFTEAFRYPEYVAPIFSEEFRAPTLEEARADPGYAFRQREGAKAIQRSAAAGGTLLTGGTLKDLAQWNQDLADTAYGNVYGRRAGEYGLRAENFARNAERGFAGYGTNLNRALTEYGTRKDVNQDAYTRARDLWNTNYGKYRSTYDLERDIFERNQEKAYSRLKGLAELGRY